MASPRKRKTIVGRALDGILGRVKTPLSAQGQSGPSFGGREDAEQRKPLEGPGSRCGVFQLYDAVGRTGSDVTLFVARDAASQDDDAVDQSFIEEPFMSSVPLCSNASEAVARGSAAEMHYDGLSRCVKAALGTPAELRTVSQCASEAMSRLRQLRHPSVLAFVSQVPARKDLAFTTPRAQTLRRAMATRDLSLDEVCAGVQSIAEGLSFLHQDCQIAYNNVCEDGVFVSAPPVRWLLGDFSFSCHRTAEDLCRHSMARQSVVAPEDVFGVPATDQPQSAKPGWARRADLASRDVYGLGVLIDRLLVHLDSKQTDSSLARVMALRGKLMGLLLRWFPMDELLGEKSPAHATRAVGQGTLAAPGQFMSAPAALTVTLPLEDAERGIGMHCMQVSGYAGDKHLAVQHTVPGSAAEVVGVQRGWILRHIDGKSIRTLQELKEMVAAARAKGQKELTFECLPLEFLDDEAEKPDEPGLWAPIPAEREAPAEEPAVQAAVQDGSDSEGGWSMDEGVGPRDVPDKPAEEDTRAAVECDDDAPAPVIPPVQTTVTSPTVSICGARHFEDVMADRGLEALLGEVADEIQWLKQSHLPDRVQLVAIPAEALSVVLGGSHPAEASAAEALMLWSMSAQHRSPAFRPGLPGLSHVDGVCCTSAYARAVSFLTERRFVSSPEEKQAEYRQLVRCVPHLKRRDLCCGLVPLLLENAALADDEAGDIAAAVLRPPPGAEAPVLQVEEPEASQSTIRRFRARAAAPSVKMQRPPPAAQGRQRARTALAQAHCDAAAPWLTPEEWRGLVLPWLLRRLRSQASGGGGAKLRSLLLHKSHLFSTVFSLQEVVDLVAPAVTTALRDPGPLCSAACDAAPAVITAAAPHTPSAPQHLAVLTGTLAALEEVALGASRPVPLRNAAAAAAVRVVAEAPQQPAVLLANALATTLLCVKDPCTRAATVRAFERLVTADGISSPEVSMYVLPVLAAAGDDAADAVQRVQQWATEHPPLAPAQLVTYAQLLDAAGVTPAGKRKRK
eukprot:TRINITY_DN11293_c0_g1_i1.p1 TRINITY_DN11293_c0_g1~~TRINITY_DN11293_c0_g1_i1.p1  ORF type:complete len:1031 (+),score=274.68 TRINITY_DN11293_c0_g1_i1:39-3095(+)